MVLRYNFKNSKKVQNLSLNSNLTKIKQTNNISYNNNAKKYTYIDENYANSQIMIV